MSISEAYNSWSEQYDSNENKTRDLDKIVTTTILSDYSFKTVLELGCGTGKNTAWLLEKAARIIGLDFSEGMLEKARQKISSSKVIFQKADLKQEWQIQNEFADLITSSLTLEHIENLNFIFAQVHSKLQNNGILFICELHPFKQYNGTKARYETEKGREELEVYTHHISDYLDAAKQNNLQLIDLKEWFDDAQNNGIPRLISFVFRK